jgi:hypothetical protein
MVLSLDHATMRTAGLSERKAEYIRSLAEAFDSGSVSPAFFAAASDQEIIDKLTEVRGIGGTLSLTLPRFHELTVWVDSLVCGNVLDVWAPADGRVLDR